MTPKTETKEMSFFDHLDALRWHLMRSSIAVVTLGVILFLNNEFIFGKVIFGAMKSDFMTYRVFCKLSHLLGMNDKLCINAVPFQLINTDLSGQFMNHMWISFMGGLILAVPYVLWEIWRFVKPALKITEASATRGFVFFSTMLFLIGVLFSYYMVFPLTVNFLGSYQVSNDVTNMISMDSYISMLTTLTLLSGVVFELPMVVYFLTKFSILTPAFMREYRKHAFIIILIASAIITPSSDIATMLVVAVPLYTLYEISIFVSKYTVAKTKI